MRIQRAPRVAIAIISAMVGWWMLSNANAADATINWVNPTQNVDDTPISTTGPGAIAGTRIEWGSCGLGDDPGAGLPSDGGDDFGTRIGDRVMEGVGTSMTVVGLDAGLLYCFRGFTLNNAGEESVASNVVPRFMPAPSPNAPVLSSTVNVVWNYQRRGWRMEMVILGTAPLGSPCGERQETLDSRVFTEIDPALVTWDRRNKTGTNTFTFCS